MSKSMRWVGRTSQICLCGMADKRLLLLQTGESSIFSNTRRVAMSRRAVLNQMPSQRASSSDDALIVVSYNKVRVDVSKEVWPLALDITL